MGGSKISNKDFKKTFDNIRNNFSDRYNRGFKKWANWSIFCFISPGKLCILIGLLITLLLSGVGLYGLLVIILLILLFIFVP